MGRQRSFTEAERSAWRNFPLANRRVTTRLDADLGSECEMTLAEYEVLGHLADAPDHRKLRMNELAELSRLSPSGLIATVRRTGPPGLGHPRGVATTTDVAWSPV